MSNDVDTARFIEDRIRDHYNARITEGKSDCDYRVEPREFLEMVQRLNAKVDLFGHFTWLSLSAGSTRVYPSPEVGRGAYEPCELSEPRAKPIDFTALKKHRESTPFAFDARVGIRLADQLGEQLLKSALKALTDQRDYSSAAKLVHAYAELQDVVMRASFGRWPSGLESGAALVDPSGFGRGLRVALAEAIEYHAQQLEAPKEKIAAWQDALGQAL